MAEAKPRIEVSVVYLGRQRQFMKTLTVKAHTVIGDVLEQSGLWEEFPGFERDAMAIGVFGKPADLEEAVHAGDRIEVYRPLEISPRKARKQRASGA